MECSSDRLNKTQQWQFDLHFGCQEPLAEGIAFVLQQTGVHALGKSGQGLGYEGISPSVAIEFDTFPNELETPPDFRHAHIAITQNGYTDHASNNNLAGPTILKTAVKNPRDCKNHHISVNWQPDSKLLAVDLDDKEVIRYTGDIISKVFAKNSMVYWGFTASTGAYASTQGVIVLPVEPMKVVVETALPSCISTEDGTAEAIVTGGSGVYIYQWASGEKTAKITNLTSGQYQVKVRDVKTGEKFDTTFTLQPPSPVTISKVRKTAATDDFPWEAEVTGGKPPYTIKKGIVRIKGDIEEMSRNHLKTAQTAEVQYITSYKKALKTPKAALDKNGQPVELKDISFIMVTDANGCERMRYLPGREYQLQPPSEGVATKEIVNIETPPVPPTATLPTRPVAEKPSLKDVEVTYTHRNVPDSLGNRKVNPGKRVMVNKEEIEIHVWDSERIDGDTISLFLNGEWILQEFALARKKKVLKVTIKRNADNYLVLYAHNEGSRPPNTAALAIYDGTKENRVGLSSDMRTCGTINFKFRE